MTPAESLPCWALANTPAPTPSPTPGPSPEPTPTPTPTGIVLQCENGDSFVNKQVTVEETSSVNCAEYFYYRGTDGRRYRASWKLYTANGVEYKNHIKYQFVASDTNGYYLDLTVKTSDNNSQTRRITFKLGHTAEPIINISDFSVAIGEVGQTYTVPSITVKDPYNTEIVKTITMYYKATETSSPTAVSTENNQFTANNEGYYGIKVVATNGYGITAVRIDAHSRGYRTGNALLLGRSDVVIYQNGNIYTLDGARRSNSLRLGLVNFIILGGFLL